MAAQEATGQAGAAPEAPAVPPPPPDASAAVPPPQHVSPAAVASPVAAASPPAPHASAQVPAPQQVAPAVAATLPVPGAAAVGAAIDAPPAGTVASPNQAAVNAPPVGMAAPPQPPYSAPAASVPPPIPAMPSDVGADAAGFSQNELPMPPEDAVSQPKGMSPRGSGGAGIASPPRIASPLHIVSPPRITSPLHVASPPRIASPRDSAGTFSLPRMSSAAPPAVTGIASPARIVSPKASATALTQTESQLAQEASPVPCNESAVSDGTSGISKRITNLLDRIPFRDDRKTEYLAAVKTYEEVVGGQVVSAKMYVEARPNVGEYDEEKVARDMIKELEGLKCQTKRISQSDTRNIPASEQELRGRRESGRRGTDPKNILGCPRRSGEQLYDEARHVECPIEARHRLQGETCCTDFSGQPPSQMPPCSVPQYFNSPTAVLPPNVVMAGGLMAPQGMGYVQVAQQQFITQDQVAQQQALQLPFAQQQVPQDPLAQQQFTQQQVPLQQIPHQQFAPQQAPFQQISPQLFPPQQIPPQQVQVPQQLPPQQIPPQQVQVPQQLPPQQIPPQQVQVPQQLPPQQIPPQQVQVPQQLPPQQIQPQQTEAQQRTPGVTVQLDATYVGARVSQTAILPPRLQEQYPPPARHYSTVHEAQRVRSLSPPAEGSIRRSSEPQTPTLPTLRSQATGIMNRAEQLLQRIKQKLALFDRLEVFSSATEDEDHSKRRKPSASATEEESESKKGFKKGSKKSKKDDVSESEDFEETSAKKASKKTREEEVSECEDFEKAEKKTRKKSRRKEGSASEEVEQRPRTRRKKSKGEETSKSESVEEKSSKKRGKKYRGEEASESEEAERSRTLEQQGKNKKKYSRKGSESEGSEFRSDRTSSRVHGQKHGELDRDDERRVSEERREQRREERGVKEDRKDYNRTRRSGERNEPPEPDERNPRREHMKSPVEPPHLYSPFSSIVQVQGVVPGQGYVTQAQGVAMPNQVQHVAAVYPLAEQPGQPGLQPPQLPPEKAKQLKTEWWSQKVEDRGKYPPQRIRSLSPASQGPARDFEFETEECTECDATECYEDDYAEETPRQSRRSARNENRHRSRSSGKVHDVDGMRSRCSEPEYEAGHRRPREVAQRKSRSIEPEYPADRNRNHDVEIGVRFSRSRHTSDQNLRRRLSPQPPAQTMQKIHVSRVKSPVSQQQQSAADDVRVYELLDVTPKSDSGLKVSSKTMIQTVDDGHHCAPPPYPGVPQQPQCTMAYVMPKESQQDMDQPLRVQYVDTYDQFVSWVYPGRGTQQ